MASADTSGSNDCATWESCPERAACDELRRKQLTRQLQEAQKLAPTAYLAAGLAHDFNNILTSVRLHADLLELADTPAQRATSVAHIRSAAAQASELVERLVEFARPRADRVKVIEVGRELAEHSKMLRRMVPENAELSVEAADVPAVAMDPVEFAQAVMNCVLNAGQALRGAGRIKVRASAVELSQRAGQAFSPRLSAGKYALVVVEDNGPGMASAVSKHPTTPFASTRHGMGGSGLGMSVVQGCAARAGGGVRWVSGKAKGTRVEIALPAQRVLRTDLSTYESMK